MVGRYFSPLGASDAATHTCQRLYDAAAATAAAEAQAGAEEEAAAKEEAAARAQAAAAEYASSAAQSDGEDDDGANLVPKPLRQWAHRLASLTVATALSALELSPTPQQQSLTPLPKPAPKQQQHQQRQSARWQAADSRFFWNKRVGLSPLSFTIDRHLSLFPGYSLSTKDWLHFYANSSTASSPPFLKILIHRFSQGAGADSASVHSLP